MFDNGEKDVSKDSQQKLTVHDVAIPSEFGMQAAQSPPAHSKIFYHDGGG